MIAVCVTWLIILAAGAIATGIDYLLNGPGL